jgi:dTDP-4-amino-4,6-dideoxygalactose transaminase
MHNIPFFGLARQYRNLRDELIDATDQVLKSGTLMNGEFTSRFESWLALRTNTTYAVTVHSGTQALEMIARYHLEPFRSTFDIIPKIKIPNITYVATLNAFLNAGWEVELVDTDKNGLMHLDPDILDDVVNSVCLVGLYGANPKGSSVFNTTIVDGAQHWLVADNVGDAMAISFDPTKNLPASGNGGAIVTNDRQLWEFAYSYRSNGKHEHETYGTNSRMSEQECAQILVRATHLDGWQWRRKEIRHYYLDEFKNLPFHCLSRDHLVHADQKFAIYTDKRNELKAHLDSNGIETKIHYDKALSEYPITANIRKPDMMSASVMLTRGLLSLPIYPELSDGEVEHIANEVKKFFTCSVRH